MNKAWQRISTEPALVTGAVMASVNLVAAFRVWTPTPEQLAAINSALAAIFGLLVRATVAPARTMRVRSRGAGAGGGGAGKAQAPSLASQPRSTMGEPF